MTESPKTARVLPLLSRVLIRPDPPETTTAGGLIIPDVAQDKVQRGTVLAVGPGWQTRQGTTVAPGVRPGQRVLYNKYSETTTGNLHASIGADVVLVDEREIACVLEDAPPLPSGAEIILRWPATWSNDELAAAVEAVEAVGVGNVYAKPLHRD